MMPVAVPQKNNLTKGQRRSTYAIICIISLLGGVEYGKYKQLHPLLLYAYSILPFCGLTAPTYA